MLSALELVRRIEDGELSPLAVVDMCAAAIAASESKIGAFEAIDIAAARRKAEDASLTKLPLRGLPVGIKDIFDTADLPTRYGTKIYDGHRPKSDAAAVMMVRRAGGIVLGKTVSTELAFLQPERTRNPHNPAHTPGGSSSGSAAGVAAGQMPLALGSQTGGSVIRPAAYCGVAGFKPSFRLLPTVGMKCFSWSLDTVGVFAARVADVAFATEAISGRQLRIDRQSPQALTIAVVRTRAFAEASSDMQHALEAAARRAEAAGAKVRDVELPSVIEQAFEVHGTIQNYEAFRALAYEYDNHRDALGPILRKMLDEAASITPDAYDEARRIARRARKAFSEFMADFTIILTPSAPSAAPAGLDSTGQPTFNKLWTLLGAPCVNVPGVKDSAGLPLGLQAVGRFARDQVTLEAAHFLEGVLARL
jgi:Asp-tRNA(Asn)/Glu-tRNA(Gln) amidotransferase A subunit family amidase